MKTIKYLLVVIFCFSIVSLSESREIIGKQPKRKAAVSRMAGCDQPNTKTDLDLNNVRATIFTASDMWWDLQGSPRYEIPKNSKKHSLFASSIWIGGIDAGKQLRVAAQTYRQGAEYDFWSGPLDTNATISKEVCQKFDKHFVITRKEVEVFAGTGLRTTAIDEWPGNGDQALNQSLYLAPFHDANGDGLYDPGAGDYPNFNLGKPDKKKGYLLGDKVLWWVFNDNGNIHTASQTKPIGIEMQAQAFAFENKPGDPISNMTFYQYRIANKSQERLDSTWFGQWADPDLGKYNDDYVGCDVEKGLGFCYNGDIDDDGPTGYGLNPPAVGLDFFEGPLADPGDGIDNDRDGFTDEDGEQIIMSQFVYFNNDATVQGNPDIGSDFYNYLRGYWRDGTHMTYGGNGKGAGPGATSTRCDFMFPGDTDPNFPVAWTEVTAGNVSADRRFIQSAGAFTLAPGAVNYITVGAVWARAVSGGNEASVALLKTVDAKAQQLFDNNFNKLKGPDAPDLTIRSLSNELILTISNNPLSNNYKEAYKEKNQDIILTDDTLYAFQGYQIFQLRDATVLGSYLDPETNQIDPDKARIVAQCDIQDSVSQIFNFMRRTQDPYGVELLIGAAMVKEAESPNNFFNKGIRHTFRVTKDYFTNEKLINNKTYYYTVIAYAYNKAETVDPKISQQGTWTPYVTGSRNSKVYLAVPHLPTPENGGQILNSNFGSGPQITRIKGYGNGGNELDLIITDEIFNKYLSVPPYRIDSGAVYSNGKGPLGIKVFDPVKVPKGTFTLRMDSVTDKAKWSVTHNETGLTVVSDTSIGRPYEQILPKWGLSITVAQVKEPLVDQLFDPVLSSSIVFSDTTRKWLSAVYDADIPGGQSGQGGRWNENWIKSGSSGRDYPYGGTKVDPNQYFEKVLDGRWAPYGLVSDTAWFPANNLSTSFMNSIRTVNTQKNMASVLLVITPDKSKWTRSPVVETHDVPAQVGNVAKLALRKALSVDKNGVQQADSGMGWFPGYAVNMETGERLNIIFGEDSYYSSENGNDMMWNPTSKIGSAGEKLMGGRHFIYIINNVDSIKGYEEGAAFIVKKLKSGNYSPTHLDRSKVFRSAIWVNVPLLASSSYSFTNGNIPPGEVKIRLCVAKPYRAGPKPTDYPLYTFHTNDLYAEANNTTVAKDAMDLIRVVPNPYYSRSQYETSQFDNRIKIVNLPPKCTISIFTVNGTLIRRITKESTGDTSLGADRETRGAVITNSVDWDLKNTAGIPISSGLYIFHVQSDGLPDKVIKWFCVMRPLDLSNY